MSDEDFNYELEEEDKIKEFICLNVVRKSQGKK